MEVMCNSYMPGDSRLIEKLVSELKSQGIFDQFRKECISDVDTKPAYQNLRQRVEGSVATFLKQQTWSIDLNKNQLREQLRKNLYESGFLETGVERIVDQVVNPKINTVFLPKVEEVVYKFLGVDKPVRNIKKEVSITDLLPTDLEAVSPESVHSFKTGAKNDTLNDSLPLSIKLDEDESPPFEPLNKNGENNTLQDEKMAVDENTRDSHLSGFSGLESHDSNPGSSDNKCYQMELSNQDSQGSQISSESHLSVVTSEDTTKMEVCEDFNIENNAEKSEVLSENVSMVNDCEETNTKTYKAEIKNEENSIIENEIDTEKRHEKGEDKRSKISEKSSKDKRDDKQRKSSSSSKDKSSDKSSSKLSQSKSKESREKERKDSKSGSSRDKDRNKEKYDKEKSYKKSDKDKYKSDKERSDKIKSDKSKSEKESANKIEKEKSEKDRSRERLDKSKSSKDKIKSETEKSKLEKDKSNREKDKSKDKHREKSDKSFRTKDKSDKEKEKTSKDKSSREKSNSSKDLKEKDCNKEVKESSKEVKDKPKEEYKEKNRSSSSSTSKHSSSKDKKTSTPKKESSSQSTSKDKSSSSSTAGDSKYKPSLEKTKKDEQLDKHSNNKKDKQKDSKKKSKDDHYSSKINKTDRRSTDRDSNDGHSSKNNFHSSESSRSENNSQDCTSSSFTGGSGDSSNSDQIEAANTVVNTTTNNAVTNVVTEIPKVKYIKPKFALNFEEARKIMKIRKQLAILEKQNKLSLTNIELPFENGIVKKIINKTEDDQKIDISEEKENINASKQDTETISTENPRNSLVSTIEGTNLSNENWEALEAKLAQVMAEVNCNSYESDEDVEFHGYSSVDIVPKNIINLSMDLVKKTEMEMLKEQTSYQTNNCNIETIQRFNNEKTSAQDVDKKNNIDETCSKLLLKDDSSTLITDFKNKIANNCEPCGGLKKTASKEEDDACYYLEKPTQEDEWFLKYIQEYILKLEKEVYLYLHNCKETLLKKGKKRKFEDIVDIKNNNRAIYMETVKKRGVSASFQSVFPMANKKRISSTDITTTEVFPLPLSPAESDKSNERKDEDLLIPVKQKRIVRGYSQRYSSEDLYKPRPTVGRNKCTRRNV